MFESPFSFEGRIRRTEYGLSMIFSVVGIVFLAVLAGMIDGGAVSNLVMIIGFIPIGWFRLAQAVKRSHDVGNSGWFILIPFYGFVLLFVNSRYGPNEYGFNPKGEGNENMGFSFDEVVSDAQ